jgi:hypothetical protein
MLRDGGNVVPMRRTVTPIPRDRRPALLKSGIKNHQPQKERTKMKTILWIALFMLGGCSTTPISTEQATPAKMLTTKYSQPEPGTGIVIVKRDREYGKICPYEISIDGQAIVSMWPAEKITLHLPLGEHVLSLDPNKSSRIWCYAGLIVETAVNPSDRPSTYRISMGIEGGIKIQRTAY